MNFRFYFPKKLKKAVRVIWEQKCNTPTKWQILPSGFIELIFRLGAPGFDDFSAKKLNSESDPSKHFCFLSGLHTRPLYITFSRFHFMGIQLKPVALPSFFEIPSKEFLDEAIEGDLLINRLQYIEEHLQSLNRFQERARWLEDYTLRHIARDNKLDTGLKLEREMDKLLDIPGNTNASPEDITGYSRTHTHRLFKKWFGLAPTEYIRFKKCMNALRSIHFSSESLTRISHQHGFYDQSHFIRTFKHYTNMTPGEYCRQKTGLVGQLPF